MIVVTVARKPLSEGTVAANVLVHGTGALNIAATRIESGPKQVTTGRRTVKWGVGEGGCTYEKGTGAEWTHEGRWPSNLILGHFPECGASCAVGCPVADLDAQQSDAGGRGPVTRRSLDRDPNVYGTYHAVGDDGASFHGDGGGAARFFKQVR